MSANFAGGRRAGQINFSSFIQDLNEIPPQQQDVSPTADEWEKDLAMFTNTNFMDWEQSQRPADFPAPQQPKEKEAKPAPAATGDSAASTAASAFGDFDFSLPGG